MAANGDRSTGDAIGDDEEKYNDGHCKYTLTHTTNWICDSFIKHKSENTSKSLSLWISLAEYVEKNLVAATFLLS